MTTKNAYPPTPELDKMKAVKEKSQAIGEFLEIFLVAKDVQLGRPHKHGPSCRGWDEGRGRYNPRGDDCCSFQTDEFESFNYTVNQLLGEFFEIDLAKVEQERRAILEYLRHQQQAE